MAGPEEDRRTTGGSLGRIRNHASFQVRDTISKVFEMLKDPTEFVAKTDNIRTIVSLSKQAAALSEGVLAPRLSPENASLLKLLGSLSPGQIKGLQTIWSSMSVAERKGLLNTIRDRDRSVIDSGLMIANLPEATRKQMGKLLCDMNGNESQGKILSELTHLSKERLTGAGKLLQSLTDTRIKDFRIAAKDLSPEQKGIFENLIHGSNPEPVDLITQALLIKPSVRVETSKLIFSLSADEKTSLAEASGISANKLNAAGEFLGSISDKQLSDFQTFWGKLSDQDRKDIVSFAQGLSSGIPIPT